MRFDRLTTKFQQAIADAQSMALAADNGYIEPQHLLLSLLNQEDSGTASLLSRAGVNVAPLMTALTKAIDRLPKVEGQGGEISASRELTNLLNLTDKIATKRGDQFIASEIFLLALADDKGDTGRLLKEYGLTRKALESAIEAVRGGAAVDSPGEREGVPYESGARCNTRSIPSSRSNRCTLARSQLVSKSATSAEEWRFWNVLFGAR